MIEGGREGGRGEDVLSVRTNNSHAKTRLWIEPVSVKFRLLNIQNTINFCTNWIT
jgi:hypothetical protein